MPWKTKHSPVVSERNLLSGIGAGEGGVGHGEVGWVGVCCATMQRRERPMEMQSDY
jgi:hypothetical protein